MAQCKLIEIKINDNFISMSDRENIKVKKIFTKIQKQIERYEKIIEKIEKLSTSKEKFFYIKVPGQNPFWPEQLNKSQKTRFDKLLFKGAKIPQKISSLQNQLTTILSGNFTTSQKFFPDFRFQICDIVSATLREYNFSNKIQYLPRENLYELLNVKKSFLLSMLNFINCVLAHSQKLNIYTKDELYEKCHEENLSFYKKIASLSGCNNYINFDTMKIQKEIPDFESYLLKKIIESEKEFKNQWKNFFDGLIG